MPECLRAHCLCQQQGPGAGGHHERYTGAAGASYGRYDDGSLNGVLYGVGANKPVLLLIPSVAQRLDTGFVDAGRSVGEQAVALGITTLCNQATGALGGPEEVGADREMYDGNRMKARIRCYVFWLGRVVSADMAAEGATCQTAMDRCSSVTSRACRRRRGGAAFSRKRA